MDGLGIYKDLLNLVTPMIGMVALYYFQRLTESVSELNKNVAVMLEKLARAENEIEKVKVLTFAQALDISNIRSNQKSKGCEK